MQARAGYQAGQARRGRHAGRRQPDATDSRERWRGRSRCAAGRRHRCPRRPVVVGWVGSGAETAAPPTVQACPSATRRARPDSGVKALEQLFACHMAESLPAAFCRCAAHMEKARFTPARRIHARHRLRRRKVCCARQSFNAQAKVCVRCFEETCAKC